jgi:hypothetical protein
MDYEDMERNETCAAELLRSVEAIPSVSAIAIALVCGLTIATEGSPVPKCKVRGAKIMIPLTTDLLTQEAEASYELAYWRLRRQYGGSTRITDEDARHCGRAILMPRQEFERDVQRLQRDRVSAETNIARDLRKLRRNYLYANDSLLLERMADLRTLAALSARKLRLVVG